MLADLLNAAAERVDRVARRVDLAAIHWLLGRDQLLPRALVVQLLERLAAAAGAKLEITELP